MEATQKLAVDLPVSTKEKLREMAHENRVSMTEMVIRLIEQKKGE